MIPDTAFGHDKPLHAARSVSSSRIRPFTDNRNYIECERLVGASQLTLFRPPRLPPHGGRGRAQRRR